MAGKTSSPDSSTRWVETSQGILSYAQLAPLLAERVVHVQQRIESGAFESHPLGEELICELHAGFCADLVPEWAGRWRSAAVQVGPHTPPPPHEVPMRMRDYALDLQARLTTRDLESLPATLAFAEGRLLSVHPFLDFNGRLARLWLWELLRRLNLPPVQLAPEPGAASNYLAALRAADANSFGPLEQFWRQRIEQSAGRFP